jgi:hypothetical protein
MGTIGFLNRILYEGQSIVKDLTILDPIYRLESVGLYKTQRRQQQMV